MMHPEYVEVVRYSPFVMGLRWVWFHLCELVAVASMIANLLPNAKRFEDRPRLHWWYGFLVHCVAFFALNWRQCIPSLDMEFMGFRRMAKKFGAGHGGGAGETHIHIDARGATDPVAVRAEIQRSIMRASASGGAQGK